MSIVILATLWGISELAKFSRQQRRDRELARIKEEQRREKERQREAECRMREEWRRQEAEANRLAWEQIRLAREQERQAAQLAKHEEQIAKLEFRMTQAESDIEHWREQLQKLYALLDLEEAEQAATIPGSKTDIKCQKRIIALTNQIHSAENKMEKAKHDRQICRSKLAA